METPPEVEEILTLMTLGDVAQRFGCQLWHIQALVSRGRIEATRTIGRWRFIAPKELPKVELALVEAGYIMPTHNDSNLA